MTQATGWLADRLTWAADHAPGIAMRRVPALPDDGMRLLRVRRHDRGAIAH